MPLTGYELAQRYQQLDALKMAAAAAPSREERERMQAHWEKQERERLQRHDDAERARAEEEQAERNERDRRIRGAEEEARGKWVAERDRLTVEAAEGRNVVEIVRSGNTDRLTLEQAEKLRVRVWLMAAEQNVEEAEAALARHMAQRR